MSETVKQQKELNTSVRLQLIQEALSDDSVATNVKLLIRASAVQDFLNKDGNMVLDFTPVNGFQAKALYKFISDTLEVG